MARAALDWNLERTADKSGVSPNTIRRFEKGGVTNQSTEKALEFAYKDAGIELIDADAVRLRKS